MPGVPPVSACNSCGAPILWAISARTRKPAPYNAAPVTQERGAFVLEVTDQGDDLVARKAEPADVGAGKPMHASHYSTCPQAAQWRSRGAR